jgi:hypothetical protein
MRLITAHKILIGAALVLALLLTLRSSVIYASTHAPNYLVIALVDVVLAALLAVYLRALWRR